MFSVTTGSVKRVTQKPPTTRTNAKGISKIPSRAPKNFSSYTNRSSISDKQDTGPKSRRDVRRQQEKRSQQIQRFEESLPQYIIESVQISTMSKEEIERLSVCQVTRASEAVEPGTVNDPRMGVASDRITCSTCSKDNRMCPGHFGHIVLQEPIIHPSFLPWILNVLQAVCQKCGALLMSEKEISRAGIDKLRGLPRLQKIVKHTEGRSCNQDYSAQGFGPCLKNPTIKSSEVDVLSSNSIPYILNSGEKGALSAREVLNIFENISDKDARLMGFENGSSPRNLILQNLPVIPPCNRPAAIADGEEANDYLTSTYKEIVNINTQISKARDNGDDSTESKAITNLINKINAIIGQKKDDKSKNSKQKSIKERISNKEGIIRNNIMGKRIDNTARGVISPDPSLAFGQVRIPTFIAKTLMVKEVVFQYNHAKLTDLLREGKLHFVSPGQGPGKGLSFKVSDSQQTRIKELQYGDTVYRQLQNGDFVILNRQPTLHKHSFMGMEVVVGGSSTIGLHMSATEPYNADFDGDEMNVHAPLTYQAMAELRELLNIRKCIGGTKSNNPMMGLVYDNISAAYLLTSPSTVIDKEDFQKYLMSVTTNDFLDLDERREEQQVPAYTYQEPGYRRWNEYDGSSARRYLFDGEDYRLPQNEEEEKQAFYVFDEGGYVPRTSEEQSLDAYSGKMLFSALLPRDFYYDKGDVKIREGILISGTIRKQHIGPKSGSIIQALLQDYGAERTSNFLTDASWVLNNYLTDTELSVGISDCFPKNYDKIQETVAKQVYQAKKRVIGEGPKKKDPYREKRREQNVTSYVNRARDAVSKYIIDNFNNKNSMKTMIDSGAKGSSFNVAQISGLLGQQVVSGGRISESLTDNTRCLPYFQENDLDPEARGFCPSSFYRGLSPAEAIFHAMGGREGLINTAVSTADTGYFQRRLDKALESILAAFDLSARSYTGSNFSDSGEILQFLYGGDGIDAKYLENIPSTKGSIPAVINIERLFGRINMKYGYGSAPVRPSYRPLEEEVEFE